MVGLHLTLATSVTSYHPQLRPLAYDEMVLWADTEKPRASPNRVSSL